MGEQLVLLLLYGWWVGGGLYCWLGVYTAGEWAVGDTAGE